MEEEYEERESAVWDMPWRVAGQALWKHKWFIILVTLIVAAIVGGMNLVKVYIKPEYYSETIYSFVGQERVPTKDGQELVVQRGGEQQFINAWMYVLTSYDIKTEIAREYMENPDRELRFDQEKLGEMLYVTQSDNLLRIGIVSDREDIVKPLLQLFLDKSQAKINELTTQLKTAENFVSLDIATFKETSEPELRDIPKGRFLKILQPTAIAGILTLLLSAALVVVLTNFNGKIKRGGKYLATYGIPVLAEIPAEEADHAE